MRYYRFIILLSALLFSCNNIDRITGNKPYLELKGSSPFKLEISDFDWGYGVAEINQFSGDFEKLDKKAYDLLEGKQGICKVFISNIEKDKYGKDSLNTLYVGEIDLTELNKYKDWKFWHKEAGVRTLIYKNLVNPPVEIDSVFSPEELYKPAITDKPAQQQESEHISSPRKTFSLTQTDLYPSEDERATQDNQSYTKPISGVITDADFYNGYMEVKTDDGEFCAVRIQPDNLPTSLKTDVHHYMKAGNRIKCVCTLAGARELIIVSVTFTDMQ